MSPTESSIRATGMPGGLVGLLALAHCAAFADRHLPAVVAPLLKADLHLRDAQLGWLDGPAFALLYIAGMLASWPLAWSPHRGRWLATCMGVWALGMVVFALGTSFDVLVAARALVGLGQSAFVPLALSWIVESAPPARRARSLAMFTAGAVIGRSASLLLGGLTLHALAHWLPTSALAHWRLLFLAMTVPNLVLIALLWGRRTDGHAAPLTNLPFRRLFNAMAEQPITLLCYLTCAGASVLLVQALGAWAPSVLQREYGLTPAAAALNFGVALLIAAPTGHLLAGALVDKVIGRQIPTTMVAGMLALTLPLAWSITHATTASDACLRLALTSMVGGTAAVASLAGWPSLLRPDLRDVGIRVYMGWITIVGVAMGPLLAGMTSDRLGSGGHALSSALLEVGGSAAIIGIAAALLAQRHARTTAMAAQG